VIDVKATGLCRSDWHGWKGHDTDIRLPHVPGPRISGAWSKSSKSIAFMSNRSPAVAGAFDLKFPA
jgi:D-arabinose 1-dehydrogenase-like Zn-dependent alcohol dehydrogenase